MGYRCRPRTIHPPRAQRRVMRRSLNGYSTPHSRKSKGKTPPPGVSEGRGRLELGAPHGIGDLEEMAPADQCPDYQSR